MSRARDLSIYLLFAIACVVFVDNTLVAQGPPSPGLPPFATIAGPPDDINVGTLNVHLEIPLLQLPGRGMDAVYTLQLDNPDFEYMANYNTWREYLNHPAAGSLTSKYVDAIYCQSSGTDSNSPQFLYFQDFYSTDSTGAVHNYGFDYTDFSACPELNGGQPYRFHGDGAATDGSGYTASMASDGRLVLTDISGVKNPNGFALDPGNLLDLMHDPSPFSGTLATDMNGNQITFAGANNSVTVTTSTGATFTVSGLVPTNSAGNYTSTIGYADSNGAPQSVTVDYSTLTLEPFYCDSNVCFPSPFPQVFPTKVTYPDTSFYLITYEPYAADPQYYTGRIGSLTTPSGELISYTYSTDQPTHGTSTPFSMIRTVSGYAPVDTTTYTSTRQPVYTPVQYVTYSTSVANAMGETDYAFVGASGTPVYETQRQAYDTTTTPDTKINLYTKVTCYNGATTNCTTGWPFWSGNPAINLPISQKLETETYSGGSAKSVRTTYNSASLVTQKDEYDFGAASGTPLRSIVTNYASLGNNILDHPSDVTVYDSGTLIAKTTYRYDTTALTASVGLTLPPVPSSSNPNYVEGSTARGNLTEVDRQVDATGCIAPTLITHYDTGMTNSVTAGTQGCGVSLGEEVVTAYDATGAFPKTIDHYDSNGLNINGTSHEISETFDANQGLLISSTDANGVITSYSYDSINRPLYMKRAVGTVQESWTKYTPGTTTTSVCQDKDTKGDCVLTASRSQGTQGLLTATQPDQSTVTAQYLPNGKPSWVSNPALGTPLPTDGVTSYVYDALGRTILQCLPDNGTGATCSPNKSYRKWDYEGENVTYQDEVGNSTQQTYDALGRLSSVTEPTGVQTIYTYNALNSLTGVTQLGASGEVARTRSFAYDQLSRLTQSYNPETGWTCYGTTPTKQAPDGTNCTPNYDGNGNLVTKTDARGVVINYAYDALNRLLSKSYDNDQNGTETTCFLYDTMGAISPPNAIGRLTAEWTQSGSCGTSVPSNSATAKIINAYDPMGRVVTEQTCVLTNCTQSSSYHSQSFSYDEAGNVTRFSDGWGLQSFGQQYDAAGRLQLVTSSWTDATHPGLLYEVPTYGPFGLLKAVMGANLNIFKGYDNRERVTCMTTASTACP